MLHARPARINEYRMGQKAQAELPAFAPPCGGTLAPLARSISVFKTGKSVHLWLLIDRQAGMGESNHFVTADGSCSNTLPGCRKWPSEYYGRSRALTSESEAHTC
jgi:hypothetical protein